MNKFPLFLVIGILLFQTIFSQGFLKTSDKVIVNGNSEEVLLRGIGLGGWLVPEGYMIKTSGFANSPTEIEDLIINLVGITEAENFFELYRKNYVARQDIEALKQWGFNSIRLPMHYKYLTPLDQPGVFLEEGFAYIDSLLAWCKANQLYLILDLHCAPGGQNDENISDYMGFPSLWESEYNKERTVELWGEIAKRYVNEEWIGGYDLINETKWDLGPNNVPLRNLYIDITDEIRKYDNNHILFIEGNWYATDFAGLTPPWDDNMAYSFHKYWNDTTIGTIQYLVNIRETHNVPLWLGETGENSNEWFARNVRLMEDNNIGWAWWPHKKIDNISGPLSSPISPGYQTLLNYWNGNTQKPNLDYCVNALISQAENLKISESKIQYDVIDALFRQPYDMSTLPFTDLSIPGKIDAVNFDIGRDGTAYKDNDPVNTGNGSYNNGWIYRNDGVDIEGCSDNSSNGYNVGWIETGEWLSYTLTVEQEGIYNIKVRIAANNSGGKILFQLDDQNLTNIIDVPVTGGWQNWNTLTVSDIFIPGGEHNLVVKFFFGGFNVAYYDFEFVTVGVAEETNIYKFSLGQNYPNPFNPSTKIKYSVPHIETDNNSSLLNAKITIYDILGKKIRTLVNEEKPPGAYEIEFDAKELTGGIYFYRYEYGTNSETKKMLFIK